MAGIIRELTHLRLLVNARYRLAPQTGVQRYAEALVACLRADRRLAAPRRLYGAASGHLWEQLILPGKLRSGEILLSPANTGPLLVRDQVLIIHDTAVLEHPEWFERRFAAWYRFLLPRLAHSARRVLTVSVRSSRHIQAALGLPDQNVAVVYPGVDLRKFQPQQGASARIRRLYGIGPRYLLWVGALEPRKNLPRLLAAWEEAFPRLPGIQLVLVGTVRPGSRLPAPLALTPGAIHTGAVGDADLAALYSDALALVLPSLEEGFGLPALEAMACGTAVIVSGTTGAAEVIGEDALMIDPLRTKAIGGAIERLAGDEDLRRSLAQRGLERVRRLTWERAAAQVVTILQEAAEEAAPR